MVELSEGFEIKGYSVNYFNDFHCSTVSLITAWMLFPLLIHRAVEGVWKQNKHTLFIHSDGVYWVHQKQSDFKFQFKNYQAENLTQCECALLDCLLNILKEV